jgi:hypothetical protein
MQLHLFAKVLCDFRLAQHQIMMLGQQNICQRLASFILEFLRVPALFDEGQSYLRIPVNRFDLADYLGTSPETTARAFASLESQGLVRRVGPRMVKVLDMNGLQNLRSGQRRSPRPSGAELADSERLVPAHGLAQEFGAGG